MRVIRRVITGVVQLYIELSKSPHRKTVAITAFDLSDTVNSVQIRANSLIDEMNSSQEGSVSTDFENIKLYEALPDQERFTDRLKSMKKVKTTLYYKGLAISAENKLVFVDKDSAIIQLSNKEFYVTAPNESIYLEFPMLGIAKASVYSVNDKSNTVNIHRFRLSKHTPLKRKIFRVDAEENMKVNILSDGPDCEGIVANINEQHIGLNLKRKRSLDEGTFVSIEIMLPVDDITTSFITEATVKKIEKVKDGFRVVVLCHLDGMNKSLIQRYIANRQMAIIHELKRDK